MYVCMYIHTYIYIYIYIQMEDRTMYYVYIKTVYTSRHSVCMYIYTYIYIYIYIYRWKTVHGLDATMYVHMSNE
jgi:hypothetical protein